MFLIEGHGKAILYTGDIRAEAWWRDALRRHPVLQPYLSRKILDTIYLDTSCPRSRPFQTKGEGLDYLMDMIRLYPEHTIFHLRSWTFGYEDVWVRIASELGEKVKFVRVLTNSRYM